MPVAGTSHSPMGLHARQVSNCWVQGLVPARPLMVLRLPGHFHQRLGDCRLRMMSGAGPGDKHLRPDRRQSGVHSGCSAKACSVELAPAVSRRHFGGAGWDPVGRRSHGCRTRCGSLCALRVYFLPIRLASGSVPHA